MKHVHWLAIAVVCLAPASAHAQQGWLHRREQECRRARMIVEKGHPEKKEAWAWELLPSCGAEGARTFAQVLRQHRTTTDTLLLEQVIGRLDGWQDSTLAAAASEVAADPAASVPARVYAIKFLFGTLAPSAYYTYGQLIRGTLMRLDEYGNEVYTPHCSPAARVTHRNSRAGTPLPGDHVSAVATLLTRVKHNEREPTAVRNAAECVGRLTAR